MRQIKTLFLYFFATASFILLLNDIVFSKQQKLLSDHFKFIKDTLPSNDSLEIQVYEKPDVPSTVDADLWRKYLQKSLVKIIEDAASNGIKNGTYELDVRFIIERDGSISNVQALNNPLRGPKKAVEEAKKEVEDIIRNGPKWIPAQNSGVMVRSSHTQPVFIMVSSQ